MKLKLLMYLLLIFIMLFCSQHESADKKSVEIIKLKFNTPLSQTSYLQSEKFFVHLITLFEKLSIV